MGVTAISIGFGALFPSINRISKPFVCPHGEMIVDEQSYYPYPGKTVTTLTWYCVDKQSGAKTEIDILPMALSAGLIYGFALFLAVFIGMVVIAYRSASRPLLAGYSSSSVKALENDPLFQRAESFLGTLDSSHETGEAQGKSKISKNTAARLKELNDLRTANLISESEYQEKRAEILKNL